jgi:hypothetical protein
MVDCNRWLTGEVARAHVVIAKNWRITATIRVYRMSHKDVRQFKFRQPRSTAEEVHVYAKKLSLKKTPP